MSGPSNALTVRMIDYSLYTVVRGPHAGSDLHGFTPTCRESLSKLALYWYLIGFTGSVLYVHTVFFLLLHNFVCGRTVRTFGGEFPRKTTVGGLYSWNASALDSPPSFGGSKIVST